LRVTNVLFVWNADAAMIASGIEISYILLKSPAICAIGLSTEIFEKIAGLQIIENKNKPH